MGIFDEIGQGLYEKLDATTRILGAKFSARRQSQGLPPICPFCAKPLSSFDVRLCPFCNAGWDRVSEQNQSRNKTSSGSRAQSAGREENKNADGSGHRERSVMNVDEARRILDVAHPMTPASVRAAYKKAAMQYHPDRLEGMAPEIVKLATLRMSEINRAKDILLAAFVQ